MKNLLKELILPSFWLFFFIVSSKSEDKVNKFKKADNTELKNRMVYQLQEQLMV